MGCSLSTFNLTIFALSAAVRGSNCAIKCLSYCKTYFWIDFMSHHSTVVEELEGPQELSFLGQFAWLGL